MCIAFEEHVRFASHGCNWRPPGAGYISILCRLEMAGVVIRKFGPEPSVHKGGRLCNERGVEATASLIDGLALKRGSQKYL
jgi:hypothetical protein